MNDNVFCEGKKTQIIPILYVNYNNYYLTVHYFNSSIPFVCSFYH